MVDIVAKSRLVGTGRQPMVDSMSNAAAGPDPGTVISNEKASPSLVYRALLRSLGGYEPYRRAYDARILPARVLEFVLKRGDFPRSMTCTLQDLREALGGIPGSNPAQVGLVRDVDALLEELRRIDTGDIVRHGSFETELRRLDARRREVDAGLELGFFTSLRPASSPIAAAPGAGLVPQQ